MNLIDTHTHLNDPKFAGDLEDVISRAKEAQVERMIVCGYDLASSRRAVELAGRYESVFATVGIHPHDSKTLSEGVLDELRELSSADKVIAIGEIGLDFHYDFSPRPDQIRAFKRQLDLASEVGLPVVIHSRESHADTVAIVQGARINGAVFHCFSGDENAAEEVLGMGFYIGVDGPVTFGKSGKLRRVVEACPIENLLIETDCPYLAPVPFRGRRNEPAYLRYVAEEVARIKGLGLEQVAGATSANARRLFGRLS